MRSLTAAQLHDSDQYEMLHELDHADLVKFVQANLRNWNAVTIFFWVANLLIVALIATSIFMEKTASWDTMMSGFSMGLFVAFAVVIVLHECIHLLAYKILGARKSTVKAQWRKLVFMALADKFVVNRREFYFLALLPFVVLNVSLLVALTFTSGYLYYIILGTLLMHTAGCSGDFALVGYFYAHRNAEIFTYDDVAADKSYFFKNR